MKLTTLKLGVLVLGLFTFSLSNAQDRQKPDPEKMFTALDTNKDASISLDEFKARKTKKEIPTETLEKRYAAMDADSNGSVTLEEYKSGMLRGEKGKKRPEGAKKKKENTEVSED
ncbi:EF-hand domain-containing protein [Mariniflexile litorale]|uniref:EF-hand domain-containing protein n=1 Tax=Mariniflexile litorale TaxID=3045158 RepID=A0AAU7EDV9_9FLAO|nr:EF-hand domain-containing protein [Mariniflexile sp. KMM 9835]MDQ8213050.1 hypothetical protein [Mariniflexile sp. KMM 9835]